jgi:pyruvate dehydrogenase E1 component alpha subunit
MSSHSESRAATFLVDESPIRAVLQPDGTVTGPPPLDTNASREALRLMILSRQFDKSMTVLSRRDEIGTYTPLEGQEASVLGAALALDPAHDWIVPSYREQAALLHHGLPLDSLMALYFGRIDAAKIPENVNILTRQQAVGAQLPHAAGLAWGLKLTHKPGVVIVFCGEGASSEGDFHEACNLAGVTNAPIVFFVQNNGWAISTPSASQTAASSFAARAIGYGFEGVIVDGNDIFGVHQATKNAVAKARNGAGPSLIESRCYRLTFHNTADNPRRYRTDAQVNDARQFDPIARLAAYLVASGAIDRAQVDEIELEAKIEIDAAIQRVRALPRPRGADVFDHVFASSTQALARQRDAVARVSEL